MPPVLTHSLLVRSRDTMRKLPPVLLITEADSADSAVLQLGQRKRSWLLRVEAAALGLRGRSKVYGGLL